MTADGFRDFGHEQYLDLESQMLDAFNLLGEVAEAWGVPDLDAIAYDEKERLRAEAMLEMLTNIPDGQAVYAAKNKQEEGSELLAELLDLVADRKDNGYPIDAVVEELKDKADPARQPRRFKLIIKDQRMLAAAGLTDETQVLLYYDDYSTDPYHESLRAGRVDFIKKPGSTVEHHLKFHEGWDPGLEGVGTFIFERSYKDANAAAGLPVPSPLDYSETSLLELDCDMSRSQAEDAKKIHTLLLLYQESMTTNP